MFLYSEQTSSRLLKVLTAAGRVPENEVLELESKGITSADYLADLMGSGKVSEEIICTVLAKGFSLRRFDMATYPVDPSALSHFSVELIEQYSAVPFGVEDGFLKVAVVDPVSMGAANIFKNHCKRNIEFFLLSPSDFSQLWNGDGALQRETQATGTSNFGMPDPNADFYKIKEVSTESNNKPAADNAANTIKLDPVNDTKVVVKGRKPLRTKWPIYDVDLVVEFCDQILRQAIAGNCSDIHIESFRESARVRMRMDGALQIIDMYSEYLFKNYQAVTTRFKILAGCDISEKRLAQDGAITLTDDRGKDIDFRFNLVPTKNGERIVMRILAGDPALSLDKIGFDPSDYKKVIEAITAPQGMVLVTGPTGSGKTTTLYGALQFINSPDINILTAEDPIEYYLEGAGQVQANEKIGLGFSSILRAFLRQDPEVILVGEIRDQETIDIAVKAALTGHLLLSTLHTNDAVSSITRMLNMGVPNFMISSALSLIVAQRLARKNCASCRVPDERITPEILKRIGFTDADLPHTHPMKGMGCPACGGSGMKGRRGIYEVLRKTKYIEEAILKNEQGPQILEAARKDGFKTMQEIGRELIQTGDISVEEYQRTLVMD
jgi:type IV pilus assembly protein PilB